MIRVWADERGIPLPPDVPCDEGDVEADPRSALAELWAEAGRWSSPPDDTDEHSPSGILSSLRFDVPDREPR